MIIYGNGPRASEQPLAPGSKKADRRDMDYSGRAQIAAAGREAEALGRVAARDAERKAKGRERSAVEMTAYLSKKRRNARYFFEMSADPNDRRHGTPTGYKYGCRCDACRAAMSAHRDARRGKR